ncbi:recombinase family protein [Streptomyces achromogenes]|uniref:recombinase family protein n=1 Tax=Streptomyces achromogenes TaxID=67255 RepID=UPI0036FBE8C9
MQPRRGGIPATFRGRPRVVGAIRLSRFTDASTSPEVQEEMITAAAERIGGEFVGWARDIDVSALKTTPWEREKLAHWLDRPEEWDALIWQRMDRAVRNMGDMADLGRYAKKRGKRLIFASGPGGDMLELDFSSPMSELIMLILAFAAQMEGQTIMERNQGAAAHLQSIGRWGGGVVPYGWIPGRRTFEDGNTGWWLYLHEDDDPLRSTAAIRRQMVARAIAGKRYSDITRWLIDSGAITPRNYRALIADPPREFDPESRWRITVVREMLLSPMLRGYTVKRDGSIVRDKNGAPILQGEPLIDDDTWFRLKDALELLENGTGGKPRSDAHPLLGVLVCGICGRNMIVGQDRKVEGRGKKAPRTGEKVPTFRCAKSNHPEGVKGQAIQQKDVLEYVEKKFLDTLGAFRHTQVIKIPGVDYRPEIEELESDVQELSRQLASLRGAAADAVAQQLQGRSDRLEELRKKPTTPPREEVVELDETWADDWHAAKEWGRARHELLLSAGVRVTCLPPPRWRAPASERLTFEVGTHIDPLEDSLDDVRYQESL